MASVGYHLRQATGCLRQSPWTTLVATAAVAVSLAACASALVAGRAVNAALQGAAADARLTVFLPEGTDHVTGVSWAAQVASTAGQGASAVFVTPDEALVRLGEELGDAGDALDALIVNPLPPTIELRLATDRVARAGLEEVRSVAHRVAELPFAADLDWGEGFVEKLEALLAGLKQVGLLAFAVALGLTLFLLGNVVRLTVYARRDEIEILRLVGATDGFIAAPFILEGAAQGVVGGIVAGGLIAVAERAALPLIANNAGLPPALLPQPLGVEWLLLPVVGLAVGVVASLWATLRFLRAAP